MTTAQDIAMFAQAGDTNALVIAARMQASRQRLATLLKERHFLELEFTRAPGTLIATKLQVNSRIIEKLRYELVDVAYEMGDHIEAQQQWLAEKELEGGDDE
jgi:hypothetical protein